MLIVGNRALVSCCAVAQAQHLVQNRRCAQQPPRGWLRAAQHAILGAQHFSPQAKAIVARRFFALGGNKFGALLFLLCRRWCFFLNLIYVLRICVCNVETTEEIGHWERHRSPTMANGEYRIYIFLPFLSIEPGAAMLAPSYS